MRRKNRLNRLLNKKQRADWFPSMSKNFVRWWMKRDEYIVDPVWVLCQRSKTEKETSLRFDVKLYTMFGPKTKKILVPVNTPALRQTATRKVMIQDDKQCRRRHKQTHNNSQHVQHKEKETYNCTRQFIYDVRVSCEDENKTVQWAKPTQKTWRINK